MLTFDRISHTGCLSMRRHNLHMFALSAVYLVACCGCGVSSGQSAPLLPVKGTVTCKGKPVTKGMIRFEPDGYGRAATGQLQPDGSFVLGTFKEGDGVIAGAHQVAISGVAKPLADDRALKKYFSLKTSGLTAEVDKEHTEFTFDLK
jgi:hypothetical protein